MKRVVATIFTCLLGAASVFATQPSSNLTAEEALQKADKQFFIENKGQWDSDVLYLTRMGGLDVWITKYGVNYTFYQIEKNPNAKEAERLPSKFENDLEDATLLGHRVLLKLQNHQPNPKAEGKLKQAGYYNYLIGNDPSKHASNVGLYKEAVVKNVYNGIDLRYYFDNGYLRYDFIVQPGADPSQIKFELDGEFKEYLKNNTLCYTTRFGEVQMQDLYAYQQNDKKQVQSKFVQENSVWQFQLSNYDKSQALIIDPLLNYSTYIGGTGEDEALSIAIDNSGNAYVTGNTLSTDYDTTTGVFQSTNAGIRDVFVTKLNSTGTGLVYSTYIGGSGNDYGVDITIDGSGNAYITGVTESFNYNITTGAFQTTNQGSGDVFVTKLNSTGAGLIYSTYIGGFHYDKGTAIAIDNSNNAYITGWTLSFNYVITSGAFQTNLTGGIEAFITKLNSTGSALIYSTYIGGSGDDYSNDIAIDGSGNAYIIGYTNSSDFDITSGAFQTTREGIADVFVTKLNSTGTGLNYSTYIGGSNEEDGRSIAVDGSGNAYITGWTQSNNFDVTSSAFQTTNGGYRDVFVTKFNSTGTALIYSTYIGGSNEDRGGSIAIDNSENAYITGWTESTNFDITSGAFQTTNGANKDVFVTKLNSTGTALIYSTYIGGSYDDYGNAIAIDGSGNAYITGDTYSFDYDITSGAFQTTNDGGVFYKDVFVTKFCFEPSQPGTISGNTSVCAGSTQTYTVAAVPGATSYTWTLPSGWTGSSTTNSITATVGTSGGNITVTANSICGSSSATTLAVVVNPSSPAQPSAITGNTTVCQSSTETYSVNPVSGATSYTWTLPSGWTGSSTTNSITATVGANSGNITVTANNGCGSSAPQTLAVSISPTVQISSITGDTLACVGSSATFTVNATGPIGTYQWRKNGVNIPGANSATYTIPSVTPSSAGTYDVVISNTNSCPNVISSPIMLNVPFTVVSDGLVFYLPFDGNTTEVVNNTSSTGSYTYTAATDRFGNPNGAANFALNTFRTYNTYPGQPTGNSPYTISTWINVASGQWNNSNGICGWGDQFNNQRNSLRLDNNGYVNYWWINDFNATIPPAQMQTGVWKHIVVTYDGTTQRFYENGVEIATRVPTIPANVQLTTTVVGAGLPNNQYYKGMLDELRIYNRAITAAEVSTLYNYIPLTAASLPAMQTICAGSNYAQTVNVTGSVGLTYQWYFNGNPLSDGGGISGTQTATLSISNLSTANAGYYMVEVTQNGCVTEVSNTMLLNVDSIAIATQPSNQSLCLNQPLNLSVSATGTGLTYQWMLNGNNIPGATSATYSVASATAADSGNYQVVVSNNYCSVSSNTALVVVSATAPAQPSAIIGNTTVCASSTQTYSTFSAGATSYTWTLPNGWTGSSTSDSIQVSVGANGGTITVIANNGCGSSAPQTLAVTVNPLPVVTVSNNANTLTVNQAGATYQWIDCNNNNAPISGATNQSFTPTTSGSYAVVVTLNGCSDTSACQTVTIAGIDTEALTKQVFSIYPNPNRGNFTIQGTKGGVFELIDVTGKVINTYTITNTQQTVNENIPAGMYFVREKESGTIQKLIVQ